MTNFFSKIRDHFASTKNLRRRVERDYPEVYKVISKKFDTSFYLRVYGDVRSAGIDPICHYIIFGWKEGRDPSPDFSVSMYLKQNKDVQAAGVEPFWHYLVAGEAEGRLPRFSNIDHVYLTISKEFSKDFYLATNPDLKDLGIDPVEHYIRVGWTEGRDPTPTFSSSYYINSNPDVREAGVNPFYHFLVAGCGEGRIATGVNSAKFAALERVRPLNEVAIDWRRADADPSLGTVEDLLGVLSQNCAEADKLIFSVSHDDFRRQTGGVQLCIQIEQASLNREGGAYLHVYPWQPLPTLAQDDDPRVCLSLNGNAVGTYPTSAVMLALSQHKRIMKRPIWRVIHSLLGHSPEQLSMSAEGLFDESYIWAHDYLLLCGGYNLLRNSVSYCHSPHVKSSGCTICVFGESRDTHIARLEILIASCAFTLLSPSVIAQDILLGRSGFKFEKSYLAPHCTLEKTSAISRRSTQAPIRVAFCGWPVYHKGWFSFESLARRHAGSPRYKFYYFGGDNNIPKYIEAKKILVTQNTRDAMTKALIENEIDVVVLWAGWPETFSFALYEALAAGCQIVTTSSSGNIAKVVEERNVGVVLKNDEELYAAFEGANIEEMVNQKNQGPRQISSINYSRMTIDFLNREMAS
ncbi:glycosyltransferase [Rhizobium lusitanum]|uniref:glycosyltransferase n=1 Tax=Rhizobium lusitanum TaxID=293958 RepID=UPI00195DF7F4|nr:glycosyltransferase [Rhizobium lusitanum]MBM7046460.1 glycosyltransferase [Rhizobium lusitanum]